MNGTSIGGYPKTYSILTAFTASGNGHPMSYANITTEELARLTEVNYEGRLADFKSYVESAEGIANLDSITEESAPASRLNATVYPIGQ